MIRGLYYLFIKAPFTQQLTSPGDDYTLAQATDI